MPEDTPGSSTDTLNQIMPETPGVATPAPTTPIESPAPIATPAGATGGSRRATRGRHRRRLRPRRPPLAARRRRRTKPRRRRRLRLRRPPLEARVKPLNGNAGADCDSGGHPSQLDGDAGSSHAGATGSNSCIDDQGRSSSSYFDSGGRQWRLKSSRSTQTPASISTPAATPGSSTESPDQATSETPTATPAPTIEVGSPEPIATPEATPGSSTETPDQATPETPAATPAPTIVVGTPAPIATPAGLTGGSTPVARRRRRR
ncbi:hypothetical protein PR003_g21403 [Phytophthora rubi]|uniref:Uncharacterized protein n=1 Tax=Phytophthora rubi TaxID=129364 RepID=A0A6A4DEJ4_9STRA|nr:hypothetical protein PR002_g18427 [Phytophthora rubi]KAE9305798.1 hypothetical protein PR003_g21403 [Phytophthora rubi]